MNTGIMVRTAVLVALAVVVQQIKVQWLAGPAVNALLIIATGYNGLWSGLLLGCLTPFLAFLAGIMPLVAVLPVIAAGNSILCISYHLLKKRNALLALAIGALLKFALMAAAVNYLIQVPPPVAKALSLPQLATAVTGGLVGMLVLRYLPQNH
ncbi:ECF transporter S component [Heliomicrobium modesticaldum]|uniref:ECF transporter S component n=1 Tax=Heliomicrobium modesticaldum TaxID=35701 RepID=UPI000675068C|nr:ECF transporter S component [Heliomicrobium modesticaldum]